MGAEDPRRLGREEVVQTAVDGRETAPAYRTIELLVVLLMAMGILVTGATNRQLDVRWVWTLLTALAIGYLLSRGLARAGVPVQLDTTQTIYRRQQARPGDRELVAAEVAPGTAGGLQESHEPDTP